MPIASINPTTGTVEEAFEPHDNAEIERRVAQAAAAQEKLRCLSYAQRAAWMCAAADTLEADVDALARTLTLEMGKPIAQSRAEVLKCARAMRYYADHAADFLADEPLADPSRVGATDARTRYHPLGVVLAIMPWNFPLWQALRFASPALMAGNAALLKHASNVPRTALYLDTLFERGGFPSGSFRTLLIGPERVEAVLRDPRVKAVTLTGSDGAGRSVASVAGAHLKKSVLELGGSDPFIVMPSAELEAAVRVGVTARMIDNGQSCIAAKRFIVHANVYDEFAGRFTEKVAGLVVGDPLEDGIDIGPLATRAGRDHLAALVTDAVAKGATVLTGGYPLDRAGWFYKPTVLADLTNEMRIVNEEVFGPVAALYRAADREEAVRVANQTPFGLSSSVWTNDPEEQAYFIDALEAGGVFVNGMSASYPELPFGGIKGSGYGRELGAAGIREFCNLKTVWRA